MNVNELRNRIILKSQKSTSAFTKFGSGSSAILDLFSVQTYFGINVIDELFNDAEHQVSLAPNKFNYLNSNQNQMLKKELEKKYKNEIENKAHNARSVSANATFEEWLTKYRNEIIQKIKTIKNNNQEEGKETGINSLMIGYPYFIGKYLNVNNEPAVFRAPLFFFNVDIEILKSQNAAFFELRDEFGLNSKLIEELASTYKIENKDEIYEHINQLYTTAYHTRETNGLKNFLRDALDYLQESFFAKIGKPLDKSTVRSIAGNFAVEHFGNAQFTEKNMYEIIDDAHNNYIEPWAVLGLFKLTNQVVIDDMNRWGAAGDEYLSNLEKLPAIISNRHEDYRESEVFQISLLDNFQKLAIKNALARSVVIDGPPGTGKSETIANLLVNVICHNKRAIFCAEKKVATDVVYKRLNRFKYFSIIVHDLKSEKLGFYQQIANNFSQIHQWSEKFTSDIEALNRVNEQLDKSFEEIEKLNNLMNTKEGKIFLDAVNRSTMNEKEMLFLEDLIHDNKFFNITDMNQIDEKTEKLKKMLEIYRWYLTVQENNFIFENLDSIEELYNFEWSEVDDKELCLRSFIKNGTLKAKIGTFEKSNLKKLDISIYGNVVDQLHFLQKNYAKVKETNFIWKHANREWLDAFVDYDEKKLALALSNCYAINFKTKNNEILSIEKKALKIKISELINEKIAIVKEQYPLAIAHTIWNNIVEKSQEDENFNRLLRNFRTQISSKNPWSVKDFFDKYEKIIKMMCPVFITSIDAAITLFPLQEKIVDNIIFDEASQIFLERGASLMYRGINVVVAGDDKQLQPTSFFAKEVEEEEHDELAEEDFFAPVKDVQSILDFARRYFKIFRLQYHYRSKYIELVQFSNYLFYDNELITCNTARREDNFKPIEFIQSDGIWENQTNETEAQQVTDLIERLLKERKHNESIGVITFNKKQANLIKSKIVQLADSDRAVEQELSRADDGIDNSLFVKNLEEVQGDERDIIIFSISFARNANGWFSRNFGPINKDNGEYRINVAVTRAKRQIFVISSINYGQILNGDQDLKKGALVFGKYLQYCEKLQKWNYDELDMEKIVAINKEFTMDAKVEYNVDFVDNVYKYLAKKFERGNFELRHHIKQAGFEIDLAIWNKKTQSYQMAIDCDSYIHNPTETVKERDYYRQIILQSKGWNVFRISSIEWWMNDKETIYASLLEQLKKGSKKAIS